MNELLEKTQAAILEKADPRIRPVIDKIVQAGKQVMYSDDTREMAVKEISDGTEPEVIGAAVAKLAGVLYAESKKTIPPQALMPAAALLLCEALQLIDDGGGPEITPEFLSDCALSMGSSLAQLFGVTPEKLQGLVDQQAKPNPGIVQGAMQ